MFLWVHSVGMNFIKIVLFISCFMPLLSLAQQNSSEPTMVVVNQVLYSSNRQTWTLRDYNLYKAVLKKYFQLDRISDLASDDLEDFLVSRLAYFESQTFGIGDDKTLPAFDGAKKPDGELGGYTNKEVLSEIRIIHEAHEFLVLKKSQITDPQRLQAWFEVLKRKNSIRKKN